MMLCKTMVDANNINVRPNLKCFDLIGITYVCDTNYRYPLLMTQLLKLLRGMSIYWRSLNPFIHGMLAELTIPPMFSW